MPQSLPDTTPPKRRFRWPTGMPQLAALLLVLLVFLPDLLDDSDKKGKGKGKGDGAAPTAHD